MSLILDPTSLPRARLVEHLAGMREGLAGTLESLDRWPAPVRHPMSFRTARDLLTDALALSDAVLGIPDAPAELLASAGNVAYSAMIAAIDLMKSHSDLPTTVPRGRA